MSQLQNHIFSAQKKWAENNKVMWLYFMCHFPNLCSDTQRHYHNRAWTWRDGELHVTVSIVTTTNITISIIIPSWPNVIQLSPSLTPSSSTVYLSVCLSACIMAQCSRIYRQLCYGRALTLYVCIYLRCSMYPFIWRRNKSFLYVYVIFSLRVLDLKAKFGS